MSEVETEAIVVDAEAAGPGPVVDADVTVAVDPGPGTADLSAADESSRSVEDPGPRTSIDASLTPEFSAPDSNPEPPTEFVPANITPAEFVPSEPAPDPSIFTEPDIASDEDEDDDLDDDDLEEDADEPEEAAPTPPSDEPQTPADAARAELEALGFIVAADAADAAVLAAAAAEAAPDAVTVPISAPVTPDESSSAVSIEVTVPVPAVESPVHPGAPGPEPTSEDASQAKAVGPKLTPISQLQTRQSTAQRGRASVAPQPFRAEADVARAEAAPDPGMPSPYTGPVPPAPAPTPLQSDPVPPSSAVPAAPAPAPTPPESPAPAASPTPLDAAAPAASPAVARPTRGTASVPPPAPVISPAPAPLSVDVPSGADAPKSSPPADQPTEPVAKPKPALKPMGPGGFSARARVAPPDPNKVPLEPTPEELAAAAQAEAARVAAERAMQAAAYQAAQAEAARAEAARVEAARAEAAQRAAHDHAMRERAAHEQFLRDQAARDQAARDQAVRDQAARDQAVRDQAVRDQAVRDQAARDQAARDQAARDQAARDQAARDQAARDQAARGHAARAQAAAAHPGPVPAGRSSQPQTFAQRSPDRDATPWSPPVPDAVVPVLEPKKRSARRWALVAGIVVVALLGGGFVGLKALRNEPTPDLAKVPVFATPGAVLAVPGTDAPIPTAAGMAAAVSKPLRDARLGTHVSFQVSDLATGQVLFSQNRFSPTVPASTMKLATASALLGLRGPNYRLTTRAVAGAHRGEVVLVGGGDPTLTASSSSANYPGAARLSDLANQVKQALGGVAPTKVIIDTSLFSGPSTGPGWEPSDAHSLYATSIYALTTDAGRRNPANVGDTGRYDNSALAAGQLFAKMLGLPVTAVANGRAAAGATELGAVQSAPLLRILETMLVMSDNVVAEFMARQVAIALHMPASFTGAAAAVTGQLTKMSLPMQGVHIVDGSGLSPMDKLTPGMLGSLLAYAAADGHPNLHGLFSGLPVAGWSGTLETRFKDKGTTGARGLFRAKTGTLTGVHALAGTVVDASGRPLVFVLLLDKVAGGVKYGTAMDKLGAAVAACGCAS